MPLSYSRALSTLLVSVALALGACAIPQPMPIEGVIEGARRGESAGRMIDALESSRTTYALRGSDFGRLRAAGVPDAVLDHVQQQFIDDVDLLTRYWVLGESVGGCVRCVPLEVDLQDMDAPHTRPTSTDMRFDRPQGMPSWYRPYSFRRGALSLGEIEDMARRGLPEQELVAHVRSSRLEGVVGVGGLGTIRTRPVAGVTGTELADLGEVGVPDAVVDEVQKQFLAQFVEIERLRYQNLGKGPAGSNN
ncbi:MAG: hypothetical protein IT532_06815 [Burkholderiales bacterium]|nr:hypothetical protein [Burkholderiales bacterium]